VLKIDEALDLKDGIADNSGSIGTIYFNQANYQEASAYYLKTLEIYWETGNQFGIASVCPQSQESEL